jgi:hypothetical protein
MEKQRGIFLNTTGYVAKESYTMATGDTSHTTRHILEDSYSTDERTLYIKTADDDSASPTLTVSIQLYNGSGWMTAVQINTATITAGDEIQISSYGKTWWIRNKGVRFVIAKTGAGAVSFTEARWV